MSANARKTGNRNQVAIVNPTTNAKEENTMSAIAIVTGNEVIANAPMLALPHFTPVQSAKLTLKAAQNLARNERFFRNLAIAWKAGRKAIEKLQKSQPVVEVKVPKNRYLIFPAIFQSLTSAVTISELENLVDAQYVVAGGTANAAEVKQTVVRCLQVMEGMGQAVIIEGKVHPVVAAPVYSVI